MRRSAGDMKSDHVSPARPNAQMRRAGRASRRSPPGYEMELGAYSASGAQRDHDTAPFDRA